MLSVHAPLERSLQQFRATTTVRRERPSRSDPFR